MPEISEATIARNVRMWRKEQAKRAVRVEVRKQLNESVEPLSINETQVELEVLHREAQSFGTAIPLP